MMQKLYVVTKQQTEFLSGLIKPTINELLRLSTTDRRVRNVLPLYAWLYHCDEWRILAKSNENASNLQYSFEIALRQLQVSFYELQSDEFEKMFILYPSDNKSNEISNEIYKLVRSLIRSINLEESLKEPMRDSVEERIRKINFEKLF